MFRTLFGAALCVGCYAPAFQSGSACETVCPGDLQCIDHVCREPGYVPSDASETRTDSPIDGPTIDGPPGDVDGDGDLDNVDNCPSNANADQHDEDGDAVGDVCDPCPHLSGNAADGDGDGVGDACDPQPAIAKQSIKFFDPFTSNKTEWQPSSGVSRVGETLRVVGSGSSTGHTRLNVTTGELRIAIGGSIVSADASTPRQLSINFGFDAIGDDYHYCELYQSGDTNGSIEVSKANGSTYTSLGGHTFTGILPTGAWSMVIDESVASQQIKLLAKLGGVDYAEVTASTNTALPSLTTSSSMTAFVQNVDIRFDYWLVIETAP